jgi:hypothetical protein
MGLENIDVIDGDNNQRNDFSPAKFFPDVCSGGIIIKKSYCCGAPVTTSSGGIIMESCSKCGRMYREPKFGVTI